MSAHRRLSVVLATCSMLAAACDLTPAPPEEQMTALTTAQTTVLGFEDRSAWSSPTATLSLSSVHTQGKSSLQVQPNGFTDLRSINLASLGVGPVRTVSFDVK